MAVRVDETGDDAAPSGIDHGVGLDVEPPAHGRDLAVGDHDAVAVEERARDVPRHDQPDVLDERPHLSLFALSLPALASPLEASVSARTASLYGQVGPA